VAANQAHQNILKLKRNCVRRMHILNQKRSIARLYVLHGLIPKLKQNVAPYFALRLLVPNIAQN